MESHPDNRDGNVSTASCTFCGGPITDQPHSCRGWEPYEASGTPSNRFDPYEALEVIDKMNLVANVQNACIVIHEQVGLLRAYITGMER